MARFTITIECDDGQIDAALSRFLMKMGSTGQPATSVNPPQSAQRSAPPAETRSSRVDAECDTCGNAMTWKESRDPRYTARFWCNTRGCKGKALE